MTTNLFQKLAKLSIHIEARRKKQAFALLPLILVTSICEVLSIGSLLPFVTSILNPEAVLEMKVLGVFVQSFGIHSSSHLIIVLTGIFVSASILAGALRIILLWSLTRFSHSVGADLSYRMYSTALMQDYIDHLASNSGSWISGIIEKTNAVVNQLIMPMLVIGSSLLLLSSIIATLIYLNPKVVLFLFLALALVYIAIVFGFRSRLLTNSKLINLLLTKRLRLLQEGFGGIRDIILNNNQLLFAKLYSKADAPLRRAQANNKVLAVSPRFAVEALGMVLFASLACYLVVTGFDVQSLLPLFAAVAIGAQRALPIVQQIYNSWANIRGANFVLEEALQLLDRPHREISKSCEQTKFADELLFDNVSFQYPGSSKIALSNVNLKLKRGARLGIIGQTGSGKSTLVDVLLGLIQPTTGEVKIDGVALTEYTIEAWRGSVAHVPQNIFISDGSIAENIAFGVTPGEIDFARVEEVCRLAQLSDFISGLPDKFDHLLGEQGSKISGGQRQRIGIARALYGQSELLVLDEATSALDTVTESKVVEAIFSLSSDITLVMVAHRISTLGHCTEIIEVQDGEAIKVGTLNELYS